VSVWNNTKRGKVKAEFENVLFGHCDLDSRTAHVELSRLDMLRSPLQPPAGDIEMSQT
jgi:hypothetical protein